MSTIKKRFERIKILGVDFNIAKELTNEYFGYELNDNNWDEFIKNLESYKDSECEFLINLLEKSSYKRIAIYSMKILKKKDEEHPIYEEMTNPMFNSEFISNNRIKRLKGMETVKYIDDTYSVTHYKDHGENVEIKLAAMIKYEENEYNNGLENKVDKVIYDSYKVIIDLKNNFIFILYNDLPNKAKKQANDLVYKKELFYNLFTRKVTSHNLLVHNISGALTDYFLEYMKEIETDDAKMKMGNVECLKSGGDGRKTRSKHSIYIHERLTLDTMKKLISENGYLIGDIECFVCSKLIRLKKNGEIVIETGTFNEEVMESVCNQFLDEHKVYELLKGGLYRDNK